MRAIQAETYANLLYRALERYATYPAILGLGGRHLTYEQMHERILRLANSFYALGLRSGARVAILLDNCVEYLEVERTAYLFGLVRVGINPRLQEQEVKDILHDSGAALLVTNRQGAQRLWSDNESPSCQVVIVGNHSSPYAIGYEDLLGAAEATAPPLSAPTATDPAVLLYSSGTTGRPKGATITQYNWAATAQNMLIELPPIEPGDLLLHAAPMSHFGGCVGQAYGIRGAAMAMTPWFDSREILQLIEQLRVTCVPLVPTMLQRLTAAAELGSYDLTALRALPYGGAPINERWFRRAYSAFGEALLQMYGLSEAVAPITCLSPRDHVPRGDASDSPRFSSVGRVTPCSQLQVVDDRGREVGMGEPGEIMIKSDTVMSGYWGKPSLSAKVLTDDGWFHTGDIGYLGADGYLTLIDRSRELIISGGFNIFPGEVERVIADMPGVSDVMVFGAPHDDFGECVVAVILPEAGFDRIYLDDVQAHCLSHLASYKKPVAVEIVDSLPENSSGKLQRKAVKERHFRGGIRAGGN